MFHLKATLTAAATILAFQTTVAVPVAGGVDATWGEFPEAVGFAPSCGGTLLNANTVLTAAHCVISSIAYYKGTDLSKSQVIAGTIVSLIFAIKPNIHKKFQLVGATAPCPSISVSLRKCSSNQDILVSTRITIRHHCWYILLSRAPRV